MIGGTVSAVKLDEGHSMRLETDNSGTVIVPLNQDSRRGPEAMHFVSQINGPIQVW